MQAPALPPLRATAHAWWIATRPQDERAALAAQLGQAVANRAVGADHFGILADAGLLEELLEVLRQEREVAAEE